MRDPDRSAGPEVSAGQAVSAGPEVSAGQAVSAGQSTAELAVLLPVLLLLILGVVQVGLVARDHVVVQHAAREAARAAAVDPTLTEATDGAVGASAVLDPDRLSVTLSGGRSAGDLLTVDVSYRSATRVPLVGLMVGDVALTASAAVQVE